jgi:hypothetical protein
MIIQNSIILVYNSHFNAFLCNTFWLQKSLLYLSVFKALSVWKVETILTSSLPYYFMTIRESVIFVFLNVTAFVTGGKSFLFFFPPLFPLPLRVGQSWYGDARGAVRFFFLSFYLMSFFCVIFTVYLVTSFIFFSISYVEHLPHHSHGWVCCICLTAHIASKNKTRLTDINISEFWSLITSTLLMETELVMVFNITLMWVITREDFISCVYFCVWRLFFLFFLF